MQEKIIPFKGQPHLVIKLLYREVDQKVVRGKVRIFFEPILKRSVKLYHCSLNIGEPSSGI